MKISSKTIAITCIICLLPMILGIIFLNRLPQDVVIHWGVNNEPNGWANKYAFVFGFPIGAAFMQLLSCATSNTQAKGQKLPKLVMAAIWVIPIISLILYPITILVGLGKTLDIRIIVCLIVSVIFIIFGNYLTKIPQDMNPKLMARSISDKYYKSTMKSLAIVMILSGVSLIISLFFAPMASVLVIAISILLILIFSLMAVFRS
ncbi:MAG: DUF1648 domain-containing protein [Clostridiales bacterium]|jgi:uncharacterized membrane protein|nr:DUF1648 domain-containing protein [Clostridiales bacterium]